jgi:DNA modification methylase
MSIDAQDESTFVNTILQGNCIELMAQLPENSVDMIFADPPH